jgi:hypothetical protein
MRSPSRYAGATGAARALLQRAVQLHGVVRDARCAAWPTNKDASHMVSARRASRTLSPCLCRPRAPSSPESYVRVPALRHAVSRNLGHIGAGLGPPWQSPPAFAASSALARQSV